MYRQPLTNHNLLFLDFETGGLSPIDNDIVEVACILTDPSGKDVLSKFEAKVFPQKPVEPKAASINGYSAEKWAAEAVPLNTALVKVLMLSKNSMMCCHNTPFDKSFLEAALVAHKMRWSGSYHTLDTVSLAMPLLRAGLVPNVKLTTLSEFFSIPHTEAHTAMGDVSACRALYTKLMEIYAPGIEALKLKMTAGMLSTV